MTLLERHRRNRRRQQAVCQAYLDRQVIRTAACLHCPWHTTGVACVMPRCFRPEPKKKEEASHGKETV